MIKTIKYLHSIGNTGFFQESPWTEQDIRSGSHDISRTHNYELLKQFPRGDEPEHERERALFPGADRLVLLLAWFEEGKEVPTLGWWRGDGTLYSEDKWDGEVGEDGKVICGRG